jgi:hypothetical protein
MPSRHGSGATPRGSTPVNPYRFLFVASSINNTPHYRELIGFCPAHPFTDAAERY